MEAVTQEKVFENSRIIYDWVSICFKKHSISDIVELLGLGDLNFQEIKGAHGYRDRMYSDYVSIHFNGRDDMGVWLEQSGQGCRIFETFGNGDYDRLLNMCLNPENEMHLTRLDVAFDDFDGLLDIEKLCDDARFHNVVTRFHEDSWQVIFGGKGNSVTFGSKKSDILVRIYDKDAEQGHVEGRHWVRVELQLRRERAEGFVRAGETVSSIGERFRGVLANYVRYVEPTSDTNKRRWPTAEYWDKLLQSAAAISIYEKPKTEYKLEQLETFVVRQAGNAIDAYIKIRGMDGFMESIKGRCTMGNPKYDKLVDALKEKDFTPRELTPEEIYNNGYSEVLYRNFGSIKKDEHGRFKLEKAEAGVWDTYGYRWVACLECGEIVREDEAPNIGDSRMGPGFGRCKKCISN